MRNGRKSTSKRSVKRVKKKKSKNIKAKWIKGAYWSEGCGMGEVYGNYYKCSNCKEEVQDDYEKCSLKYCPYCGARMDGDVNE